MDIDELYQAVILDHARRPRNLGELPPPAVRGEGYNPSCGDQVTVYVLEGPDATVQDIRFTGQACAICMASASLMTTQVKGKSLRAARELERAFVQMLTGGASGDPGPGLGNLQALAGVKRFPQRLKCATLCWHALEDALDVVFPPGETG